MSRLRIALFLVDSLLVGGICAAVEAAKVKCHPQMEIYINQRVAEFDRIPDDRRDLLGQMAKYVRECRERGKPAKLTFICTHNSRRSHMSQLWAAVAAAHYGLEQVETFSGGTESTAFNPRAVAALKRAGFIINSVGPNEINPHYTVSFSADAKPLHCFSKVYDAAPNPSTAYCAIMTCSDADKNCPVVQGAEMRLAIPFVDPKASDGTPHESLTYDERCAQIAREMLYAFSQAS